MSSAKDGEGEYKILSPSQRREIKLSRAMKEAGWKLLRRVPGSEDWEVIS